METDLKKQLMKSVDNIKRKLKTIQKVEDEANLQFKKVFKPITDPLETMVKVNVKTNPNVKHEQNMNKSSMLTDLDSSIQYDHFRDIIQADSSKNSEYYDFVDDESKTLQKNKNDTLLSLKKEDVLEIYDNINVPFGIRSENKKLMMGNSIVVLSLTNSKDKKYMLTVNNENIELTPGLKELLLRNKPNLGLVTEKDKAVYKELLINTNAHKRDYNSNGQLKGDKGLKYCQIIKPFFSSITDANQNFPKESKPQKIGGNLPELKKYKRNTDYVYWDDPNELIDRLKLLIASKNAGNTNHDNEIVSIIEELKEAGIIKE